MEYIKYTSEINTLKITYQAKSDDVAVYGHTTIKHQQFQHVILIVVILSRNEHFESQMSYNR